MYKIVCSLVLFAYPKNNLLREIIVTQNCYHLVIIIY